MTGLILLVVVYSYIVKLFRQGFKPVYAAFTFPLAIAASYKLSSYFTRLGEVHLGSFFKLLGDIQIFIATYVVFFILLNFINMFFKAINPKLGFFLENKEKILGGAIYHDDNDPNTDDI